MTKASSAPRITSKARRKDNAARVTAQGLATLGNAKARRKQAEVASLPETTIRLHDGPYVMREHTRRDIGTSAHLLDLDAADRPDDAMDPFTDPDGVRMGYAVRCLTHPQSPPRFCATPQQAARLVKATHQWCKDCALLVEAQPNSKASSQATRSR